MLECEVVCDARIRGPLLLSPPFGEDLLRLQQATGLEEKSVTRAWHHIIELDSV
jgi:hypothetical protein